MASNKGYKEAVEAELARYGLKAFYWEMRGKHEACYFRLPDGREIYTAIPCTPGDQRRGPLNQRSDLRKQLAKYGIARPSKAA